MHSQLAPAVDPATSIALAAQRTSIEALRDDLVVACGAARAAVDAVPTTTFDWVGPASDTCADATARLHARVVAIRDALATAARLAAGGLA